MITKRKLEHSQNFIRQPKLVKDILGLSTIGIDDCVVEIGPGKGIITQGLLEKAGHVIAVERDTKFTKELSLLHPQCNLQLVVCDFLEWQLPQEKYKVFSNIPFNYTADIITKLTSSKNKPTDIYLIMQDAAFHRFAGIPYEKNSQTSILLAINFSSQILMKIDRHCFDPIPTVNIVFVHFAKRSKPLVSEKDQQNFRDFVVYGYNQWKPTVIEAFRHIFSKKQLGIITKTQNLTGLKPSDLTVDQWIELFNTYCKYAAEDKKEVVYESEKRLKKTQTKLDKQHRTRNLVKRQQTFP